MEWVFVHAKIKEGGLFPRKDCSNKGKQEHSFYFWLLSWRDLGCVLLQRCLARWDTGAGRVWCPWQWLEWVPRSPSWWLCWEWGFGHFPSPWAAGASSSRAAVLEAHRVPSKSGLKAQSPGSPKQLWGVPSTWPSPGTGEPLGCSLRWLF